MYVYMYMYVHIFTLESCVGHNAVSLQAKGISSDLSWRSEWRKKYYYSSDFLKKIITTLVIFFIPKSS